MYYNNFWFSTQFSANISAMSAKWSVCVVLFVVFYAVTAFSIGNINENKVIRIDNSTHRHSHVTKQPEFDKDETYETFNQIHYKNREDPIERCKTVAYSDTPLVEKLLSERQTLVDRVTEIDNRLAIDDTIQHKLFFINSRNTQLENRMAMATYKNDKIDKFIEEGNALIKQGLDLHEIGIASFDVTDFSLSLLTEFLAKAESFRMTSETLLNDDEIGIYNKPPHCELYESIDLGTKLNNIPTTPDELYDYSNNVNEYYDCNDSHINCVVCDKLGYNCELFADTKCTYTLDSVQTNDKLSKCLHNIWIHELDKVTSQDSTEEDDDTIWSRMRDITALQRDIFNESMHIMQVSIHDLGDELKTIQDSIEHLSDNEQVKISVSLVFESIDCEC
jgi:hypothetical protein